MSENGEKVAERHIAFAHRIPFHKRRNELARFILSVVNEIEKSEREEHAGYDEKTYRARADISFGFRLFIFRFNGLAVGGIIRFFAVRLFLFSPLFDNHRKSFRGDD